MSRKRLLSFVSLALILTLVFATLPALRVNAEDSDFPVTVELNGVIQSISDTQLALTDGTLIKINDVTKDIAPGLKAGVAVTVTAEMDDEQFVATSIQVSQGDSVTSGSPSDDGKGDDNGKNANSDDDKGKGKGKGKNTNSDDNGKGKGKGKDNQQNDKDTGKSNADKAKAQCLSRTDHPVATQLATSLGISYTEIMKWHCDGIGFGEIARAYLIAKNSKLSIDQIFALRKSHKGWGQIIKAAGLNAKDISSLGKLKGNKTSEND